MPGKAKIGEWVARTILTGRIIQIKKEQAQGAP